MQQAQEMLRFTETRSDLIIQTVLRKGRNSPYRTETSLLAVGPQA